MWFIDHLSVQYIHSYCPCGSQLFYDLSEPIPSEFGHTRPGPEYLQDGHLRWGEGQQQSLDRALSESYPSPRPWNPSRYCSQVGRGHLRGQAQPVRRGYSGRAGTGASKSQRHFFGARTRHAHRC